MEKISEIRNQQRKAEMEEDDDDYDDEEYEDLDSIKISSKPIDIDLGFASLPEL